MSASAPVQELAKYCSSAQLCAPIDIDNNTLLHVAAKRGHLNTVRLLIKQTFDTTSARNNHGKTPIHLAAEIGHIRLEGGEQWNFLRLIGFLSYSD